MKAAQYLGVPPWELAAQPSQWFIWASVAQTAEAQAQQAASKGSRPE